MSGKRFRPKVCGCCARVDKIDLDRKFCPTTANRIYANKPAGSCIFFVDEDGFSRDRRKRRRDDVLDE